MKNYLLVAIAVLILAACSDEDELAVAPTDIAAGRAMAQASCAGCHGLDGRGAKTNIPNLAAQPAEYLVDALYAYKDGQRSHAALQDMVTEMSDADIRNIAGYYSALPPLVTTEIVETPQFSESSYQEGSVIAGICADCHGQNGYSQRPGIPNLAGQQPAYLIVSTMEYVNGNRGHAEKEAMLEGLGQIDIEKMAMYFASQSPAVTEAPPFGDPARGEPLSADCGECHGARGISHDPLVPSLAGQEPRYLVNAIKAYQGHEREHEDMMTDIGDGEIEDIAAFYAVQIAETAAVESLMAQDLAAKCDRCHAPTEGELSMAVPSLSGQNRGYLVKVMRAYREDNRGSSMMHKMSSNYSDEMIEDIATYYANDPGN